MKDPVVELARYRPMLGREPEQRVTIDIKGFESKLAELRNELGELRQDGVTTVEAWSKYQTERISKLVSAVESIELPSTDLSPVLASIQTVYASLLDQSEKLTSRVAALEKPEQKPKEWVSTIERNNGGGIKRVVAFRR